MQTKYSLSLKTTQSVALEHGGGVGKLKLVAKSCVIWQNGILIMCSLTQPHNIQLVSEMIHTNAMKFMSACADMCCTISVAKCMVFKLSRS